MINETVILLTQLEDFSWHRLAKYRGDYLTSVQPFDLYLYKPLKEIFSKVIAYDYNERLLEVGLKGINKEVITLVRKEHPKYVICNSAQYEFQETTFDIIRKEGTIVLRWFRDDEVAFDYDSKWWIPHIDYCVTNSIETVPKYKTLGARPILAIPIMGGIPIDRDWSDIEEKYEVTFVGLTGGDREQYINEIKKRNIPISLFGRGRGGRIPFEEMIDVFKTSKINLNFSGHGYTKKMQLKGRIFEVCLAGGFLLTEYVPGIENYFKVDKEIVCFKNTEEMIDKITYYLNHDEERRAIAQAGWRKAIGKYTSFHVLSRVFSQIEEDIASEEKETLPFHPELKMPRQIRKRFSDYYLFWGEAFLLEGYKRLWQDAFALTISYYPFNFRAWCYYIMSFSPSFMRPLLFRLFDSAFSLVYLGLIYKPASRLFRSVDSV